MSLLSVPLKTILFYCADSAGEALPLDYAYCDGRTLDATQQDIVPGGSFVTPDLRNRLLLGCQRGASASQPQLLTPTWANQPQGAPGPNTVGGGHTVTLDISQLPNHSHNASTDPAGGHSHTIAVSTNTGHTHSAPPGWNFALANGLTAQMGTNLIDSNNIYIEAVEATGTTTQPDHGHAGGDIQWTGYHLHAVNVFNSGGGVVFDTRPTMIGLVYVMKVKT